MGLPSILSCQIATTIFHCQTFSHLLLIFWCWHIAIRCLNIHPVISRRWGKEYLYSLLVERLDLRFVQCFDWKRLFYLFLFLPALLIWYIVLTNSLGFATSLPESSRGKLFWARQVSMILHNLLRYWSVAFLKSSMFP